MTAREPRSLRVLWVLTAIAAGILVVAVAHTRSRTGDTGAAALFWLSVTLIVFPAALTLAGTAATRGERVTMLVAVGLGLYAIKVLRDPFAFTFGDELAHFRNLQEIDRTGELYGTNSILPVTPRYPGVEALAQGVSETGSRSLFSAGLILIAAARTVFMIAVYLIFERISGSMRHASLAALICAAAPTFLFFSAQFSYESLAVPLAMVAVFLVVRRQSAVDLHEQRRWGALLVRVGTAIACTHHLPSYALLAFLLAVVIGPSASFVRSEVGQDVFDAFNGVGVFMRVTGHKYLFSLSETAEQQIKSVRPDARVSISSVCTISDSRFHSHRREGSKSGRNFSFVLPVVE